MEAMLFCYEFEKEPELHDTDPHASVPAENTQKKSKKQKQKKKPAKQQQRNLPQSVSNQWRRLSRSLG